MACHGQWWMAGAGAQRHARQVEVALALSDQEDQPSLAGAFSRAGRSAIEASGA
jgi:hypothetical protein